MISYRTSIIKMLSKWNQVLSLAILGLNVIRIAALDTRSIESDFDSVLKEFEEVAVDVISDTLDDSDGVLAHITMDYNTYAKPP
jgi:hypothetical protein